MARDDGMKARSLRKKWLAMTGSFRDRHAKEARDDGIKTTSLRNKAYEDWIKARSPRKKARDDGIVQSSVYPAARAQAQ